MKSYVTTCLDWCKFDWQEILVSQRLGKKGQNSAEWSAKWSGRFKISLKEFFVSHLSMSVFSNAKVVGGWKGFVSAFWLSSRNTDEKMVGKTEE